jgi:hypothetical protein
MLARTQLDRDYEHGNQGISSPALRFMLMLSLL